MAYVRQDFVAGNKLKASELNHMEDGIQAAVSTEVQELTEEQKEQARKNIGAAKDGTQSALSEEQINAVAALFRIASYAEDASSAYAEFCNAFGIVAGKINFEAVKAGSISFFVDAGGMNLYMSSSRATIIPIGYYLTKGKTYSFSLGSVSGKYYYGVQVFKANSAGLEFPHDGNLPEDGMKVYQGISERIVDVGWKNADYTYTASDDNLILAVNFKNNAGTTLDESNYAEILENFIVTIL